ncbi:MAG: peptidoglycan DD-metalloendopeptidase family protein [Fidelibacterota bacterium]|nr:MAG: peptidoglycan DD-metalloendopeptidase family protein [Candidatus Neomarinimicrobiota bacterium]
MKASHLPLPTMRAPVRYALLPLVLMLTLLAGQTVQDLDALDRRIESKQDELQGLRDEIRLYERRIARQEQAEKDALSILFNLEERISLTSRLIKALESEGQQLTTAINLTQRLIRRGEGEIAALKEKLSARFVHVYKQRRSSMLELILTSDNWNQAAYRAKYLKVAADYDRYLTNKVKSEIRRLEEQKRKLARDRIRKQEALREKEREEGLLRKNKSERQRQIAKLKQDRRNDERLLVQKRRDVAELERIIAGLEFDRDKRAKELAEMRRKLDLATVADISYYRGKLPWPTGGRVIARFGQQRNPELNTITENPGIDIQTSPGTPVKSVLDGLVTTITYIRTYGTTVIIDHGKDLYTVYALVEDVAVAEGQYVDQGQLIAHVGANGGLGTTKLHFEVWANQVKQDPAAWLITLP